MLNYVALIILILVALILFYGIIAIHDIPYDIAKRRNHPHQDAIHVAGWISLFTLHVIWPFLWIWATLYRSDRGWGFDADVSPADQLAAMQSQIVALNKRMDAFEPAKTVAVVTEPQAENVQSQIDAPQEK